MSDDPTATELEWRNKHPELMNNPEVFGFIGYDIADYTRLLDAAITVAPEKTFLEIGCGPGTKCIIARNKGLTVEGIEIFDAYADEAQRQGITVHRADVRNWDHYGDYGIIYNNHPLRDDIEESRFEQRLRAAMAPGAVLVSVTDCGSPPQWRIVVDERDAWRGVYVKPGSFPRGGTFMPTLPFVQYRPLEVTCRLLRDRVLVIEFDGVEVSRHDFDAAVGEASVKSIEVLLAQFGYTPDLQGVVFDDDSLVVSFR